MVELEGYRSLTRACSRRPGLSRCRRGCELFFADYRGTYRAFLSAGQNFLSRLSIRIHHVLNATPLGRLVSQGCDVVTGNVV